MYTLIRNFQILTTNSLKYIKIPSLVGFSLLNIALSTLPLWSHANTITFTGRAYDIENKERLLYEEIHKLDLSEDNQPRQELVTYQDPDGNVLATKKMIYGNNPSQPNFTLESTTNGYQEGVIYTKNQELNNKRIVYNQESESAKRKEKILKMTPNTVIDGGFHYFVLKQWNSLMNGENIKIKFLSTARLKSFDFSIKKMPSQSNESDSNSVIFKFTVNNPFIQWLLKPIYLTYDQQTRRLMQFEGITNLSDKEGKSYKAVIYYEYEPYQSIQ